MQTKLFQFANRPINKRYLVYCYSYFLQYESSFHCSLTMFRRIQHVRIIEQFSSLGYLFVIRVMKKSPPSPILIIWNAKVLLSQTTTLLNPLGTYDIYKQNAKWKTKLLVKKIISMRKTWIARNTPKEICHDSSQYSLHNQISFPTCSLRSTFGQVFIFTSASFIRSILFLHIYNNSHVK